MVYIYRFQWQGMSKQNLAFSTVDDRGSTCSPGESHIYYLSSCMVSVSLLSSTGTCRDNLHMRPQYAHIILYLFLFYFIHNTIVFMKIWMKIWELSNLGGFFLQLILFFDHAKSGTVLSVSLLFLLPDTGIMHTCMHLQTGKAITWNLSLKWNHCMLEICTYYEIKE